MNTKKRTPKFIQIHTLRSFPSALLNRDDTGLAKRLPFAGTMRTRISSQCLKRHWRVADGTWSLNELSLPRATRTRRVFAEIYKSLVSGSSTELISEEIAQTVVETLEAALFQKSKGSAAKSEKSETGTDWSKHEMSQAVLFGHNEIEYLKKRALEISKGATNAKEAKKLAEELLKSEKDNFREFAKSIQLPGGLESALFGRMVTSDVLANMDAAIHVAHAFTVHENEIENDYLTVVDDLKCGGSSSEQGSGGIFDTELTSGLYYGYVVIDVPLLVSNIIGCRPEEWDSTAHNREVAGLVVKHLLHLIAKETPGAKKGSTAPYSWAEFTMVELGLRQPRTLANAFRDPVRGTVSSAVKRLNNHLGELDECYGRHEARGVSQTARVSEYSDETTKLFKFDDLADWVCDAITKAEV
jgi:CRISPR system Cascade subunit CasC